MVELTQITHEQLSEFVRSKSMLHEALMRSGFRLPSVNAACTDLSFLMGVRDKTIWCPLSSDVKESRLCFSPPPKTVLLEKLQQAVSAKFAAGQIEQAMLKPMENFITAISSKPANVDFLVLVIGVFKPDEEIFTKSYVWKRPVPVQFQQTYDNADGIFTGLPHLPAAVIRRTNRLRVPKEKSLELKLLKVQQRQEELAVYQSKLQAEMASVQAEKFKFGGKTGGDPVFLV